jgi:tetratricopeptide (TPR) repeat protein/serine/threonine protein kinase
MAAWDPRANQLFLEALELTSTEDRRGFLDRACGQDPTLRAAVEALLAAGERAGSFLERPALDPAAPADSELAGATEEYPPTSRAGAAAGGTLGPYRLVQLLGSGGMGEVWLAEQQAPVRRPVALKVIRAGLDSAPVLARFEQERQALALMDHPHIAKVLDAGATPQGRPYFVMELVQGVPLTRFCDEWRLTVRERLELFGPLCQAVQHAHQKGIIHRDLKPSNVLVTVYDGRAVVKVIDFGVAKAIEAKLTERTVCTEVGSLVGTLEYMSPEQADPGNLDIDTRADVYALGVILYELLTGAPPFSRRRLGDLPLGEMLRRIREVDPPRPSARLASAEVPPGVAAERQADPRRLVKLVRGELDWIAMKCLEKDRERRYESASALARDIERYLRDEPVQAGPPSAGYRLRKFVRRHRGAVLATAAVGLAVLLGVVGTTVGLLRAQRAEQAEGVVRAERRQGVLAAVAEARRLREQARYPQARAVLAHALAGLGTEPAPELSQPLEQARSDLELIAGLDATRLRRAIMTEGKWDYARADRDYAAALRESRIVRKVGEDPAVVAARVRAARTRTVLVAALDEWANTIRDAERRAWVLEVARLADPDPVRERLRDPALGRDPEALTQLALAVDVRARSPQFLAVLGGKVSYAGGDAVPLLKAAQAAHPDDFWLNFELGHALHVAKRDEEAIGFYRAALALRPDSSPVHHNIGVSLRDLGRLDEAIDAYQKAIDLEPNDPLVRYNLGGALRKKGRDAAGLAAYRKAVELARKAYLAPECFAFALAETGRPDEAIREYRKAIALNPRNAMTRYNLGNALSDKGEVDKAIAEYRRAIALDPRYARARVNLGNALRKKGEADEAITEFRRAIALDPKLPNARMALGNALMRRGQVDDAIIEFRRAIALDPKLANARVALANVLHRKGEADEAITEYRRAIALDPKNFNARINLGNALKAKGEVDKAIAEYRQAIALDPRHAPVRTNLGNALHQKGDVDGAIAEHRKAIALDPRYAPAYYNLGNALHKKGQVDEAITEYRKAIALNLQYAPARVNLGNALRDKGQVEEAIAEYREAIALDPRLPNAPLALGRTLAASGRLDDAIAVYSQAIGRRFPHARFWWERANCYARQGKWSEATADYAEAGRREPRDIGPWHFGALARLAARDRDGYRRLCDDMLRQFGKAETPNAARTAVWTCTLTPDAVADFGPLAELAEALRAKDSKGWGCLGVVGAALYRAGRFKEAVARLDEACAAHSAGGNARDWLLLALAHHRLGNADQARHWLARGSQWLDKATREKLDDRWFGTPLAWHTRLSLDLLRREAEGLIRERPASENQSATAEKK